MRVRRQTVIGEVDTPAIEEFTAGRDRDEDRCVAMLGDTDGRGLRRSSSRHLLLLRAGIPPTDARSFVRLTDCT
jgi:hypothetical protein